MALISHTLWTEQYGGDEAIVGTTLQVDGEPVTVAGVMPPGFQLPGNRDEHLWIAMELVRPQVRAPFWMLVVARPADGVGEVALGAALERVRATLSRFPLAGLLDELSVCAERPAPEALEVGAECTDAGRIEAVDAASAHGAVDNQPGFLQHPQMLRNRRPADRQVARDLVDRARPLGDALEDRPAGGIAERGPGIGLVSRHER